MQRFFAAFPGERPGVGLLLLRATVGVAAIVQAGVHFVERDGQMLWTTWAFGLPAVVSGALLLIGFLTPVVAILGGLASAALAMSRFPASNATSFDCRLATLVMVAVAGAIVFLGPGAFSVDSHLFGRREIIIPPSNSRKS